jgi:hypothetical protein
VLVRGPIEDDYGPLTADAFCVSGPRAKVTEIPFGYVEDTPLPGHSHREGLRKHRFRIGIGYAVEEGRADPAGGGTS